MLIFPLRRAFLYFVLGDESSAQLVNRESGFYFFVQERGKRE
jgi:hypothetical protein